MTASHLGRFPALLLPLLVASLAFATVDATCPAAPPDPSRADCGTIPLYLLLRAEGRETSLPSVESLLPDPNSEGHSMKDLRDGARGSGRSLRGRVLPKEDRAIDRPMIVFLRRRATGHFVFVRPVGQTGKLVQAIDPPFATAVMDKANLFAMPEWTGLTLVPSGDRRLWWAGCGLLVAAAIATVLHRAFARWGDTSREAEPAGKPATEFLRFVPPEGV